MEGNGKEIIGDLSERIKTLKMKHLANMQSNKLRAAKMKCTKVGKEENKTNESQSIFFWNDRVIESKTRSTSNTIHKEQEHTKEIVIYISVD